MPSLDLDPDRLLPADPTVLGDRAAALRSDRRLPIVSPARPRRPRAPARRQAFPIRRALLVTPDHYVTRLLHAHGVAS